MQGEHSTKDSPHGAFPQRSPKCEHTNSTTQQLWHVQIPEISQLLLTFLWVICADFIENKRAKHALAVVEGDAPGFMERSFRTASFLVDANF